MNLLPILFFPVVICLVVAVVEAHDHDHDGHRTTKKTTTKSTVRTSTKPATTTTARPTTTTTAKKTTATTPTSKTTSTKPATTTTTTAKLTTAKTTTSGKTTGRTTTVKTTSSPSTTTAKKSTVVSTTKPTTTTTKKTTTAGTTPGIPSTTSTKSSSTLSSTSTSRAPTTATRTASTPVPTTTTTKPSTTTTNVSTTTSPEQTTTSTAPTTSTAEADTTSTVSTTRSSPSSFVTSTTPSTTTAESIPSTTPSEAASSSTLWTTTTTLSPIPFDCAVSHPACGNMCTNLTPTGGVVQSPNYPGDYGNGSRDCFITITAPAGWMIQLNFTTFNLETGVGYVEIFDDSTSLLPPTSGNTIPALVRATIGTMFILFSSGPSDKPSTAIYNWRATFSVTSQGSSCSVPDPGEGCGTMCTNVTSNGTGVVQSLNYPGDYGNQARTCYVTIIVPAGKRIQLKFPTFNLETGYAYIYVGDRRTTLLSGVTGSAIPPVVTTTANIMYIRFYTSASTKPTTAIYNWQATYTAVTEDATSTTPRLTTTKTNEP